MNEKINRLPKYPASTARSCRRRLRAGLTAAVAAAAGALALTFATDVGHALAGALIRALRLLP